MSAVLSTADAFNAHLKLQDGATVYITAPTIDLLAHLVAHTKGQLATPAANTPSTVAVAAKHNETATPAKVAAPKPAAKPADTPPTATPVVGPAIPLSAFADEITDEMLRKIVVPLVGKKGRDAVVAMLAAFGVTKASELPADKRPEVYAALTAALEG